MSRTFPLLLLLLCALPGSVEAQATQPSWTLRLEREILWSTTAPALLVVGTEQAVIGHSQDDGTERWRLEIPDLAYHRIETLPYLTRALLSFPRETRASYPSIALIDLSTGEEIWTSNQNNLATVHGSFLVPQRNGLLVYGQEIGSAEDVLMLLDLPTGVPLWKVPHPFVDWEPAIFGEGAQPPIFDGSDTMILFLNGRSIRKYDLDDGRLIWEAQNLANDGLSGPTAGPSGSETSSAPPTLAHGYAPMLLADDGRRFFAPHHDTVGAFSTYNGARRWLKTADLEGFAAQMELVPQGLLVRSVPCADEPTQLHWLHLLDLRNGHELWRSPRRKGSVLSKVLGTWLESTPFLVHQDRAVIAADGVLFAIDLQTGEESQLCELSFEGSDSPFTLELRDDEYLVLGDQNAVWCHVSGGASRRVHYEPPEGFLTGMRKLLLAALDNATDEIRIGAVTLRSERKYVAGLDDLLRDYTATLEAREYFYMLTPSSSGPQLVRISKNTGNEDGRITVGTVEPEYRVCPYTGNLLWQSDERTISCFTFH